MKYVLVFVTILVLVSVVRSQTPPSLETILDNARNESLEYRAALSNLVGDELKTFTAVNGRQEIRKRTTVRSKLLIFKSGKSDSTMAELRVVEEVNGKPIPDAVARSAKLIEELSKESTAISELDRLQSESTRYDDTFRIYGVTLNQSTVLHRLIRPSMDFKLLAESRINDRKMFRVGYLQTSGSEFIVFNPDGSTNAYISINVNLPKRGSPSDLRLRGTIWIDCETFRIWREERDVILSSDPSIPLISSRHDYATSEFDALLPTTITFTIRDLGRKNGRLRLESERTAVLSYSKFRKTNVEIRIEDDDPGSLPTR